MTKRVESGSIIAKLFDEFSGCVQSLIVLDEQSGHLEGDDHKNEWATDEFLMRKTILAQALGCFPAANLNEAQMQFYALLELLNTDEKLTKSEHEKLIYMMLNSIAVQLENETNMSRSESMSAHLLRESMGLSAHLTKPAAATRKAA